MAVINTTAPLPADKNSVPGGSSPVTPAPTPAVAPGSGANATTSGVGGGTIAPKPIVPANPGTVTQPNGTTAQGSTPAPASAADNTDTSKPVVKPLDLSSPAPVVPPVAPPVTPPPVAAPVAATTTPVTTSGGSSDGKTTTPPVTAPAPATPATTGSTVPASGVTTGVPSLDSLAATAQQWVNGSIDQATYQTQLNQAINSLALSDNAAMEQLKTQINSNPSLQGQPGGIALVTLLAQQQGLSVDTVLGNLDATTQQTILQMQQFGFTQLAQIQQQKQTQTQTQISNAITAGDFKTAAQLMSDNINAANPGMNVSIDPNSIAARDPQTLTNLNSQMSLVTSLAATNPDAATTMLEAIMATPAGASLFPPGSTAASIIQGIHTGAAATTIANAQSVQTEINNLATSGTSFAQAQNLYQTLQSTGVYNFTTQGQGMTLDQINAIVTANGGKPYSGTPGNITDAAGNPLTETDYQNLAMQSDYHGRVSKAAQTPMQTFLQTVQQNFPQYFNTVEFPGAVNAIDAWAALVSTPGNYTTDPTTGAIVPNPATAQAPWLNPATAYLFNTWPSAHFNSSGQVVDSTGKLSTSATDYYGGMDAIGSQGADGSTINATPDAQTLDKGYSAYTQNGQLQNALTMQQWYFATAGGTMALNTANIPSAYAPSKAQSDAMNSGGNGLGAGGNIQSLTDSKQNGVTVTPTGFAPQSGAALNVINNLITNGSFSGGAEENAPTINNILAGMNNVNVNRLDLPTGGGGSVAWNYTGAQGSLLGNIQGAIGSTGSTLGIDVNNKATQSWLTKNIQTGKYHASGSTADGQAIVAMINMVNQGMTAQQAYTTMALYLGADYMSNLYQTVSGSPPPKAWQSNTYTSTSDNTNGAPVPANSGGAL